MHVLLERSMGLIAALPPAVATQVADDGSMLWVPVVAALMLLVIAGLGLINTGLGRGKNSAHSSAMVLMAHCIAVACFFACGYALMCGGIGARHSAGVIGPIGRRQELHNLVTMGRKGWGYLGASGFFLSRTAGTPATTAWFVVMALYMSVAAAIPIGSMLERWRLRSLAWATLFISAVLFPIYGCWTWGGGWLAQLGPLKGMGHGVVDFAGSSVVHLLGAGVALAGTLTLGPRLGKYDERRRPRPIFGHHVPMVIVGSLLAYVGYFGFNAARGLVNNDAAVATLCLNTFLCGSSGALVSAMAMWRFYRRPDPSLLCNGLLAGLVASSAGCAFMAPWAAFVVGAMAGLLVTAGVLLLERRGIDDPVGAISVHGICGIWGMLAVGLFADGRFGNRYNGVSGTITGLFYGGSIRQLLVQLVAVVVCLLWSIGGATLAFAIMGRWIGPNRVSTEVEYAGLDIPELGAPGYPEFIAAQAPETIRSY